MRFSNPWSNCRVCHQLLPIWVWFRNQMKNPNTQSMCTWVERWLEFKWDSFYANQEKRDAPKLASKITKIQIKVVVLSLPFRFHWLTYILEYHYHGQWPEYEYSYVSAENQCSILENVARLARNDWWGSINFLHIIFGQISLKFSHFSFWFGAGRTGIVGWAWEVGS